MIKNKRGMADIALILIASGVALVTLLFSGPIKDTVGMVTGFVFPGSAGGGKNTESSYVETSKSEPIFVTDEISGKTYVLQKSESIKSNSQLSEQPKQSFMQRILSLPRMWVLLMVLGLFFPPVAGLMGMFNRKAAAAIRKAYESLTNKTNELKGETKVIVKSIDAGLKVFDSNIAAANAAMDVAIDPTIKASYQAVLIALTNTKNAFLAEMSKKQNASTKVMVSEMKQT